MDYAAGFVVRRFTSTKPNPNMNSENKTKVASDAAREL
jgi:hypothetical protein